MTGPAHGGDKATPPRAALTPSLPAAVGPAAAGAVLPRGRGAEPGGGRAGQSGRAEGPPALHAARQPVPLLPGERRDGGEGGRGPGEPSQGGKPDRSGAGGTSRGTRAGWKGRVRGTPSERDVGGRGAGTGKGTTARGAAAELAGWRPPAAGFSWSWTPCWEFLSVP